MEVLPQPSSLQARILRVPLMRTLVLQRRWRIPCYEIRHFLRQRRSASSRRMFLHVSLLYLLLQSSLFSSLFCFLLEEFFLGPLNLEDPAGKTGEMPRAEAALVVGTNTSVAPSRSALPQVDRIKLAQEHVALVKSF